MIHCGSVRQAAAVVSMQEVSSLHQLGSHQQTTIVDGCDLSSAMAAASALLDPASSPASGGSPRQARLSGSSPRLGARLSSDASGGSGGGWEDGAAHSPDLGCKGHIEPQAAPGASPGCIALVRFRFMHRPEWLKAGARLIVRDQTESALAGAGLVQAIFHDE